MTRTLQLYCITSDSGNYFYSHDNVFTTDCYDCFTSRSIIDIENIANILSESDKIIITYNGKEKEVDSFKLKIQLINLSVNIEFAPLN